MGSKYRDYSFITKEFSGSSICPFIYSYYINTVKSILNKIYSSSSCHFKNSKSLAKYYHFADWVN